MSDLFSWQPGAQPGATQSAPAFSAFKDPAHPERRVRPRNAGATRRTGAGVLGRPWAPTQRTDAELRALITAAYLQLDEWMEALGRAEVAASPYLADFYAAHEECGRLHQQWGWTVTPEQRAERLAAYDRRMAAGQAAHPHKQVVAEAKRMVKALRDHVRDLNLELGS